MYDIFVYAFVFYVLGYEKKKGIYIHILFILYVRDERMNAFGGTMYEGKDIFFLGGKLLNGKCIWCECMRISLYVQFSIFFCHFCTFFLFFAFYAIALENSLYVFWEANITSEVNEMGVFYVFQMAAVCIFVIF